MPKFRLDEDTWPVYQTAGSWAVAMVLVMFEGFGRHFADQGASVFIGMLIGLPIVATAERRRRGRNS